ncbi:MAG: RDD family protein, partial [Firmicutes bacterium]|nr:RDD family protein [Bacillota bacterium]
MVPSFEKRVRAFAIDTSAVMLFIIVSMPLCDFFKELPYIVSGTAFVGFYFLPYVFTKGQTFGKRIQKIRVVDMTGADIQLWR